MMRQAGDSELTDDEEDLDREQEVSEELTPDPESAMEQRPVPEPEPQKTWKSPTTEASTPVRQKVLRIEQRIQKGDWAFS